MLSYRYDTDFFKVYFGSRILAEADSAGVITRYYIYGHGLIGFYLPGTVYFTCHYDISGNMIAVSDDTGAVAGKFLYTPFGEVIDRTITNPDCDIPVGFAGAFGVLREPNGLYYMNARYYDPTLGRFLSEDPLGLGGGDLTLYSYAGNNPVVFVDPSGLCAESGGIDWTTVRQGFEDIGYGGLNAVAAVLTLETPPAAAYFTINAVSSIGVGSAQVMAGFLGAVPLPSAPPGIDFIFSPGIPRASISVILGKNKKMSNNILR